MKYLIYGLGKSGKSAAKSLSKNNEVIVTDDSQQTLNNTKDLVTKKFDDIDFSQINKVILAPGIPLFFPKEHPILEKQRQYNFELICDIDEFYQLNKDNIFIGITGTNGKSTTTALLEHIFKNLNIKSSAGGNIGTPVFDFNNGQKNHSFIFEISSFQLDLVKKLKLNIACLLNITPDHLDRHGSMENYIKSKTNIFNNQTSKDYALVNIDDDHTKSIFDHLKTQNRQNLIPLSTKTNLENGFSYIDTEITIKTNFLQSHIKLEHEYLKGIHNKQNILSALATTICFLQSQNKKINLEEIINSIKNFKGLKHRQEFVRSIDNINFINDSKATNSDSTKTALNSYKNIFLILGGREKDGISNIIPELKKVKKIYLIGESSDNFAKILEKNSIDFVKNKQLNVALENAFFDAQKTTQQEQINILLSPACSSYDQFKNFEERGEYFCKLVNELQKS